VSLETAGVSLVFGAFTPTPSGLIVEGSPSFDEWAAAGAEIGKAARSSLWWVGDWLNYGEAKWGEKYAQAMEATRLDYQTLANAKWLAREFEFSRRREKLSVAHHDAVAALPARDADAFLAQAEAKTLSMRDLRQIVRDYKRQQSIKADSAAAAGCTTEDLNSLILAGRTFGTIYADPPWQYGNQGTRAATDNHYGTMPVEEIARLPVAKLAADQCHLHLWTTNGFLREALGLLDAWGFEFKSTFVWVKPQLGIGNYWRCSHEILLLGVRGGLTFPPTNIKSWLEHDRTRHSAKPEAVRSLIEQVSPPPFLELFGRHVIDGWTVWGNEIDRTLFDPNSGGV
jgi:N6-adenosine-specific RNA methylase IME4